MYIPVIVVPLFICEDVPSWNWSHEVFISLRENFVSHKEMRHLYCRTGQRAPRRLINEVVSQWLIKIRISPG